jgi:predicted secreted protein
VQEVFEAMSRSAFQIRRSAPFLVAFLSIGSLAIAASNPSNSAQPAHGNSESVNYTSLPLSFEPNLGQTDKQVQWLARGPEYTLFLAGPDAVLKMDQISPAAVKGGPPKTAGSALRMDLLGAQIAEKVTGEDPQHGKANYFTGNDSSKWQTNVPMYGKVRLKGVYPGIDLVYYGRQGRLEYDFVVAPGADPSAIRWSFDGARAKLAENGDLVLPVAGGGPDIHFDKPVVYQTIGGVRRPVDGSFLIARNHQVSFKLGAYDRSRALIIDPTLIFLGAVGTGYANTESQPYGMTVDALGEIILTGITGDPDYPVTTGALQTACNTFSSLANQTIDRCQNSQGSSGFVTKISADGTSLIYATYLHGISGMEYGYAVAADASGDAYVEGATSSYDFPVTSNAYQSICQPWNNGTSTVQICNGYFNGGGTEYTIDGPSLFIAELNPSGSALLYSTFFGGTAAIYPEGLALDSAGNMYFTGFPQAAWPTSNIYPNSGNFNVPTTANAVQTTGTGAPVASFSVLSADGSTLLYSTFLGDNPTDTGYTGTTVPQALAVGPDGMAYVGGYTNSSDFPVTAGVAGPSCPSVATGREYCNNYLGFLTAIDVTTGSLIYSEYVGGPSTAETQVLGLTADSSNNVYVTGTTSSPSYPTSTGAYQTSCQINSGTGNCGDPYAFLTKIDPTGATYLWSTYFGNTRDYSQTSGNAVALDAKGQVYLYGYNNGYGWDLPVVNPLVPLNGNSFVYVATFSSDGTQLLFSSPIFEATSTQDYGVNAADFNGFALDSTGNIYVTGSGNDAGVIITTPGTYATTGTGVGYRGYFAKVSPVLPGTTTTLTLSSSTVNQGQPVTFTATVAGTTQTTPTPTGTVTLSNGNTTPATTIGTITLGAGGSGTYTTSTLDPGSYSVTASYSGDENYDVSVSSAQTLTVNSIPSTTLALTATPSSGLTYGQPVTLTATVSESGATPTGSVTFMDGSTTLGSGTLNSSGVATLTLPSLPAGTAGITASYAGNASTGGSSNSLTFSVAQAPLTVTAANATRVVDTPNPTLTGTVTGAVNGDTFTATYSTTATTSSPAGTYPIVPAVTGTNIADYNVTLVNGTLTVTAPSATTTALAASASSALIGTSLTFTATVTTKGSTAPTGTVTFKDGSTTLGTGTLNGSGVATYTTAALALGSHSITASYAGDTNNAPSASSAVTVSVTLGATSTTLAASSTSLAVGTSVTFTATVTGASGIPAPTGAVTFTDGETTLGTGTLNSSGVATYSTSSLATGAHSVTASYAGDANNAASTSTAVALTVWPGPPSFSLTLSPSSGSFAAGTPAVITITVTSVDGFSSATSLSCGSLPKDTVCTFSSTSITPSVSGTATSTLTIDTDTKPSTASLTRPASGSGLRSGPSPVSLASLLGALLLFPLLGWKARRLRRLLLAVSALVLLALFASGGMTGCGGGGPKTPAGNYSIQVTATAGSVTQQATYSLTVQ